MQTWYEAFYFAKDPYEKLDPYNIDFERLIWDRPDLEKAKEDVDKFLEDIVHKQRVALKIFGPAGSGKTWLTRIIQKELIFNKKENALFLYTKVPRMEPTFQVVYRIVIEHFFKNYFDKLRNYINEKKGSTDLNAWKDVIEDEELALCFSKYASGGQDRALARKWLIGDKLSASELSSMGMVYSLDSDYERFEMLRKLIERLLNIFSTCVLVIDELENASVKLAGQISDGLRDMLDVFSERFALIASFTAQKADEWYDLGYTESLGRRFDFTVELASLRKEIIPEFLRLHHKVYRKKDVTIEDEIFPFEEDSAIRLMELMSPEHHYPGYFLPNCKDIARRAAGKKQRIDVKFVEENFQWVTFK
ncbi:MAG: hypothetical protein QW090_04810 [Candidatus Bathyarchaeia archaeon]